MTYCGELYGTPPNPACAQLVSLNAAGWEEHRQSLDVRVGTNGVASSLELILYRFVMDTGYGQAGPMLAWEWGTTGVYGDEQNIRNTVSRGIDQFITEYLRANPECGR